LSTFPTPLPLMMPGGRGGNGASVCCENIQRTHNQEMGTH
jgi:hypothetical protein